MIQQIIALSYVDFESPTPNVEYHQGNINLLEKSRAWIHDEAHSHVDAVTTENAAEKISGSCIVNPDEIGQKIRCEQPSEYCCNHRQSILHGLHTSVTRLLRLTTQAQRPGPRDATIATVMRWPGSLQWMVGSRLSYSILNWVPLTGSR